MKKLKEFYKNDPIIFTGLGLVVVLALISLIIAFKFPLNRDKKLKDTLQDSEAIAHIKNL